MESRDVTRTQDQRSSIDLSIQLENELDAGVQPDATQSPMLDPDVLSSLIVQLRTTIAELTQTRDDLLTSIAHAHAQQAELRDACALSQERNDEMSAEISQLRDKSIADEDTISLLRQKVEESRRGLMRLQTEQRRQSSLTPSQLDLSKTAPNSRATKRASFNPSTPFTPLTGSSFTLKPALHTHRRVSSASSVSDHGQENLSFHEGNLNKTSAAAADSIGYGSQQQDSWHGHGSEEQLSLPPALSDLLQPLQLELREVKLELEATQRSLSEANEATEASDACCKVLRDFISKHRVGESAHSIPPLPPEAQDKKSTIVGQWAAGLRLWRSDSNPVASSSTTAQRLPIELVSNDPVSTGLPPPISVLPLSRKLGSLFGKSVVDHRQDDAQNTHAPGEEHTSSLLQNDPSSSDKLSANGMHGSSASTSLPS